VYFEDHGQDFLEWDLDENGVVIACRPFQEGIWKGTKVLNSEIRPGEYLLIAWHRVVKYPVERVIDHGRGCKIASEIKRGRG